MPQRTSKILLVRLTANKNALLFWIRVTFFARYTVWFGITRSDQNKANDYFRFSTISYFNWFPLHTRIKASFAVYLTHGVYRNSDYTFVTVTLLQLLILFVIVRFTFFGTIVLIKFLIFRFIRIFLVSPKALNFSQQSGFPKSPKGPSCHNVRQNVLGIF